MKRVSPFVGRCSWTRTAELQRYGEREVKVQGDGQMIASTLHIGINTGDAVPTERSHFTLVPKCNEPALAGRLVTKSTHWSAVSYCVRRRRRRARTSELGAPERPRTAAPSRTMKRPAAPTM